MLEALKITSLRPGANPNNPQATNAVNYDESKANPYPKLPDPLVLKNGKKVSSAKTWRQQRRPEIVEDFDREVYGRVPKNAPKVIWEATTTSETKFDIPVVTKQLIGHVDNSAYQQITVNIQLTLVTPAGAKAGAPVIMEFGFGGPRPGAPPVANRPAGAPGGGAPNWQQQLLMKGWGYAVIVPTSIQADNGAGLTQGVIGLCNKGQPRNPDDWGALRAWAWGASRALDYFETDKAVDARQVGIEGLSRYGKAALVTMAYDQRFAIGFIGSSGEGGAKLHRRNFGELVENLTGSGEYHWMAGNFIKYGGPLTWADLPVDAHELIALCAPRPVLVSASEADTWSNPGGQLQDVMAADCVYRFLGTDGFTAADTPEAPHAIKPSLESTNPPLNQLLGHRLGFHMRPGKHSMGEVDWKLFLDFADKQWRR